MLRTARRLGVLTLVLITCVLSIAQADDIFPLDLSGPAGPFFEVAAAERQAATELSTIVAWGVPVGLSTSAARMSSESVRAQFWRPAQSAQMRSVVVKEGQSLWDIASAWGISVETIAAANGLAHAHLLKPGQQLQIPVATDPSARARLAAQAADAVVMQQPKVRNAAARTPGPAPRRQAAVRRTGLLTVTFGEGQTLWSLAQTHGVSVDEIMAANGVDDPTRIRTGRRLVIPGRTAARAGQASPAPRGQARASSRRPLTVTLAEGQTLWSVARANGVSVDAIVEANGLSDANQIRAGRRLVIPGRTAASSSRVATARVRAAQAGGAFTKAASTASTTAVRIARGFLWPARGQLTSRFGWRRWRHHDGIDIAAPYGSPIYAARPGRVVFSGWYYAYGRAVIVDHGDGVQTLYGHASKLLAQSGETVTQGQLIARVGTSGRSTGPHLHFEVRVNGRPVNPMRYMN